MNTKRVKNRSGAILVLAVIMVITLLIIGLAVITMGQNSRLRAIQYQFVIESKTAADAGLAHALNGLNANANSYAFYGATLPGQTNFSVPGSESGFAPGTKFTYLPVTGSVGAGGSYTGEIVSTGYAGTAPTVRTVHSSLKVANPFLEGALISRLMLDVRNMTQVSSINTSGDPSLDLVPTRVGSTSITQVPDPSKGGHTLYDPVQIGNNGVINANVVVGVGGSTDLINVGSSIINGTQGPLTTEFIYPPVVIQPQSLALGSASNEYSNIKGTTEFLNSSDSGKYSSINLKQGSGVSTLDVNGGDVRLYVTGDFTLDSGSILQIETGSSLTLYIDGNINAKPGCIINNLNNAGNFRIYGTNITYQSFNFQPNSNMSCAIYAPYADVTMQPQNNGLFVGGCIANNFAALSNFNFVFDKALAQLSPYDPVFFAVKRWWEEDVKLP